MRPLNMKNCWTINFKLLVNLLWYFFFDLLLRSNLKDTAKLEIGIGFVKPRWMQLEYVIASMSLLFIDLNRYSHKSLGFVVIYNYFTFVFHNML